MLKTKVLKILQETDGYISGQSLCEMFGVSRTAIWKVIKKIKEEGYQIESVQNKGYHLVNSPDLLSKSEILNHLQTEILGKETYAFDEIGSTNVYAKELGEQGKAHGTLVVSETQTDGRGRRGRSWTSPKASSISMSVLLRPQIMPDKASMLTLVMAHAVLKALDELKIGQVSIKWPNDVLLNEKKVCGILTEMSAEPDMVHYVIIGTGINVNMDSLPKDEAPYATSLKAESGKTFNRAELVARILFHFESSYDTFMDTEDLSNIKEEYNRYLVNMDRKVCVKERKTETTGIAKGITDDGKLLVQLDGGEMKEIFAGEVSVRGIYGYV